MDFHSDSGTARNLMKKRTFAAIAFDKMDKGCISGGYLVGSLLPVQENRQNESGEPGATPQVPPIPGVFRNQIQELSAIGKMALPDVLQGFGRYQILGLLPLRNEVRIDNKTVQCFM